jgi:hypothetical protein
MSVAYRVFLLHPDRTLYRVPHLTLRELCTWSPELRVPAFAGERIPFAHVYVQMNERVPIHVQQIEGQYVRFDARGALDTKSLLDARFIGKEPSTRPTEDGASARKIIDARARFDRARCVWTPSIEIKSQITEIALMRAHAKVFSVPRAVNVA